MNDEHSRYLQGEKLYGDDFSSEEILKWFQDEAEGYASLGAGEHHGYRYGYHQLNERHAFRYIRNRHFGAALGIGSAYGDEFTPLSNQINEITILDPSNAFSSVREIAGVPCNYVKPLPGGDMPFEASRFDLITSLGVMHHIPNVSHVIGECYRCLNAGGVMLLREPIVSMGDWRQPRPGLTKRERGIPLKIMDKIIKDAGFHVRRRTFCIFPVIPKVFNKLGIASYNNYFITAIDAALSRNLSWNVKYHRNGFFEKLAPANTYYVLEK